MIALMEPTNMLMNLRDVLAARCDGYSASEPQISKVQGGQRIERSKGREVHKILVVRVTMFMYLLFLSVKHPM